jgi:DNA-binding MarR family transcriptional regulator
MQVNPTPEIRDPAAGVSSTATVDTPNREQLTEDLFALASYLMRRANVGLFERIAELDLSFTQIKALCALEADGEERSLKGLADSMGLSLPAISRAVDGLYERGLVSRDEHPGDRRVKRVRLTSTGHAVPRALSEARLSALQELTATLGDEESDALAAALALVLDRNEQIAAYRPTEQTNGAPA